MIRGFGLFGILVVNLPFMANTVYHDPQPSSLTLLISALFQLKFYLLFSFVFGYSFGLQLQDPAKTQGLRRRLAGFFAFGLIDSLFLFVGDILTSYSLLGLLLLKFRHESPRKLWRMGIATLTLAVLVYGIAIGILGFEDLAASNIDLDQAKTGYLGSFGQGAIQRAGDLLLVLPFLAITNWLPAFGIFCWSLAAAKTGALEDISVFTRQHKITAWLCLTFGLPANVLFAFALSGQPESLWLRYLSVALSPASAVSLSFAYLYGLAWLHLRWPANGAPLELAGRLSLTNYLSQNLFGCFLFCGWGLGQLGRFGPAQLFCIAAAWFFVQLIFSKLYLRWFIIGPDEWLLRSVSKREWQPLLRVSQPN